MRLYISIVSAMCMTPLQEHIPLTFCRILLAALPGEPNKPDESIDCLYEDNQTQWWFSDKSTFPLMRAVNKRCVICFGFATVHTDSMCISYRKEYIIICLTRK